MLYQACGKSYTSYQTIIVYSFKEIFQKTITILVIDLNPIQHSFHTEVKEEQWNKRQKFGGEAKTEGWM